MAECRFEGCGRPVKVKSMELCQSHYMQQRRGQELRPIRKRLEIKPAKNGRTCTTCLTFKPFSEYYKSTNSDGKVRPVCKKCSIKSNRQNRSRKKAVKVAHDG